MRDRVQTYRERCRADGRQDIIAYRGVKKYGKVRYGDDGMLYIGRKRIGSYMDEMHYNSSLIVVRHAEKANIHRFEQLRWDLLLRLKNLYALRMEVIGELKKLAVRNRVVGLYREKWVELYFEKATKSISQKVLEVNQDNVLDAMVGFARNDEEHRLVAKFLRVNEWIDSRAGNVHRLNDILQALFRDLNPEKSMFARQQSISVTVNGRTYISSSGRYPADGPDLGWPCPMLLQFDLDSNRPAAK
jgi:hypothetical protein